MLQKTANESDLHNKRDDMSKAESHTQRRQRGITQEEVLRSLRKSIVLT